MPQEPTLRSRTFSKCCSLQQFKLYGGKPPKRIFECVPILKLIYLYGLIWLRGAVINCWSYLETRVLQQQTFRRFNTMWDSWAAAQRSLHPVPITQSDPRAPLYIYIYENTERIRQLLNLFCMVSNVGLRFGLISGGGFARRAVLNCRFGGRWTEKATWRHPGRRGGSRRRACVCVCVCVCVFLCVCVHQKLAPQLLQSAPQPLPG